MKDKLLRALMYNIIGLFIMGVFYFLKYDINKTHTKEMLLIIFISEVCYWLTVLIGLLVIYKLRKWILAPILQNYRCFYYALNQEVRYQQIE